MISDTLTLNLSMLLLSVLLAASVAVTEPVLVPKCQVKGTVEEVSLLPAYELDCVKAKNCSKDIPPSATSRPERYSLKLKVLSVEDQKCVSYYGPGTTISVFVNKADVKPGGSFVKGQAVDGSVTEKDGSLTFDAQKVTPPAPNTPSKSQNKESFFDSIIRMIKELLGGK